MILNDLVLGRPMLEKLAAQETNAADAIKLAKFIKKVYTKINNDFEPARQSLIQKYGSEQEDGSFKVDQVNEKAFMAELQEILNEKVDIEPFLLRNTGYNISSAEVINVLNLFE